jgi:hypothetical protein
MQTGFQLHRLFAIILTMSFPAQPEVLWDTFKAFICDDLEHMLRTRHRIHNTSPERLYDLGLYKIDKIIRHSGKSLSHFPTMPQFTENWDRIFGNCFILEQWDYNQDEERASAGTNIVKFNPEQQAAFETIIRAVDEEQQGKLFF